MPDQIVIIAGAVGGMGLPLAPHYTISYRLLLCDMSPDKLAGLVDPGAAPRIAGQAVTMG